MTYELQESIIVPSSPEEVYALVSDVTRTGEWSPQCRRCEWEDARRGVGARFVGHNRTPEREWSTTSEVIADVPGAHFAWSVGPGRAEWGYRLRPVPGGTELTEYTRTTPLLQEAFAERYGDRAEEEIARRQDAARAGIPATLAAIREVLAGAPSPIRVLTQNIRTAIPGVAPGEADRWEDRARVLADLLRSVDADVIGVQEVALAQIPVLDELLRATHLRLGIGREGGGRGEHVLLWLRLDRFEVLDWDQLWLAEDPRRIGAVGWDGRYPRVAVWARARDRATGVELVLATTHLDHGGETAREKGAGLLAQRLREESRGAPVILTGDFNAAGGDSIPWRVLRDAGYADAHDVAAAQDGPDIGTFPDYGEAVEGGERIDWILVRGAEVLTYAARDHQVDGVHASDHAHVLAEVVVGG